MMTATDCSRCGTQSASDASFCKHCGSPLGSGQNQPGGAELASLDQRFGSFLIDGILGLIPYLSFIFSIINLVMIRRGNTIGLRLVGARIVREKRRSLRVLPYSSKGSSRLSKLNSPRAGILVGDLGSQTSDLA